MLEVEEREIATRLFEDMADSRSGKLDDEMTELRLWRPGHLLEAGTSHRSSSRLTSGVRPFEVKIEPSDALVHDQSARILIDELVECHRTPFGLNSTATVNRSLARSPDLPVELANLIEVRSHAGIGKFWIVLFDRFEDRDMRIEGDSVLAGIGECHASLFD